MTADRVRLVLVNTNQLEPRTVVIQAGAYAEHRFESVSLADRQHELRAPSFTVRLAPGSGGRLEMTMKRYVNQPTLAFPWD